MSKVKYDMVKVDAMISSCIVDLGNNQLALQWTKIGNLQTSAGSLLTLISLVAAVVLGVVSNNNNTSSITTTITIKSIAFYISFISSVVYMIISCVFMFLILRTKYIYAVPEPIQMHEEIIDGLRNNSSITREEEVYLFSNSYLLEKVNDEINNTDMVLKRNRFWYGKCLISSFLSLAGSILSLLFVTSELYNSTFIASLLVIFSFLVLLSAVILILYPRRK